ncbi:MAG: hypothetical protein GY768_17995 [Planctomycetaceae bacterium]|nr:hypothetical protein [Planctomycetaceae bacterium]
MTTDLLRIGRPCHVRGTLDVTRVGESDLCSDDGVTQRHESPTLPD